MVAHGLRILNYCLPDGREEGGRDCRGGGGGFQAAYLHLYINPGFSNQTEEKTNCLQKHSRGIASITYFPAAQTLENDLPHLLLWFFLVFFF